ncbi:YMGG-like glycine zipper-containing protein [Desulfobacterales bacterium HSG16]|nr:YMGG-like glycine zipper-containing protein [Desulfobacterales bacterium HSG16]
MMKKTVSCILILAFLTGCAGMSDDSRTKAEGAGGGAAVGAAVGALIGQLAGKDTESTLKGAALGAAIGAIAGGAYGNHVANKKSNYAKQEDYLNACVASARQINRETEQYNASLRNEVDTLDAEVNQMIAMYNKKKIKRSAMKKEKVKVQKRLADARKKLKRARDEVAIQKRVYDSEKQTSARELAKLNIEIRRLEKAANELETQTQALADLDSSIRV